MSFQQFLQSEIAPQRTVAQPDASSFLATAAGTALNVFSVVQERGMENEFAGEVQRIINLNDDLIGQNIPLAKRTQRLKEEISLSYAKDPTRNLELRKTLATYGIGAGIAGGGAAGRGGMGSAEAPIDQRNLDIQNLFASLPSSFVMLHVDVDSPGGITIDVMEDVIKKHQKFLVDTEEQERLKSIDLGNQIQSSRNFSVGMGKTFETVVGPSMTLYEKELDKVDIKSPEGVQKLEALRNSGLVSLATFESLVLNQYASALSQITDRDAIFLMEKQRDAQLKQIESLRTNFFSPDSELDVQKQRVRLFEVAKSNFVMENLESLALVDAVRNAVGDAAIAAVIQFITVENGKRFGEGVLKSAFSQIEANLEAKSNTELAAGGDIETVRDSYETIRSIANRTVGTGDLQIAESTYANWLATSQRMITEGAHPSDLQGFVDDANSWSKHWDVLNEDQKENVMARADVLRVRIANDPVSGFVRDALDDTSVQWDAGTMQFVPKEPKKLTGALQVGPTGAPVSSVFSQVNAGRFDESMKNVNRVKADKYNKRVEETVQAIIRRRKRESGQELTREQAMQLILTLPKKQ